MLELTNLNKSFKDVSVLKNVSFYINNGERVALLGSNGSGKTTIIRSICGLLRCDKGDLLFKGQKLDRKFNILDKLGVVLEGSRNTNWRLTPQQNARYFSGLKGMSWSSCKNEYERLAKKLNLEKYSKVTVGKLSTGNKQKVALLCALIHKPQLLIMDEPTLGLDLQTVDELESMLIEYAKNKKQGFLITSHDFSFIENICTKILLLNDGEIVFDGSMQDFKTQLHAYELSIGLPKANHNNVLIDSEFKKLSDPRVIRSEKRLVIKYDRIEQILSILAQLKNFDGILDDLSINSISAEKAYKYISQSI